MPATGLLIGTPAAIRPSVAPQTLAIELEPFDLQDVGDDADRVGEVVGVGQHRLDAPLGQGPVADFAPARAADRPALRPPRTTGSSSASMNFCEYSSTRPSTRCSSRPVPRVTVTRACVSPRWNTAEPCTRGSTSTLQVIGRSGLVVAAVGPGAGEDQVADDARLPASARPRRTPRPRHRPRPSGSGIISAMACSFSAAHGLGPGLLALGLLGLLEGVVVLRPQRVEQRVGRRALHTAS